MNTVIMMGRLTRDPEVRYTQDQTAIAHYSLAVDRRYKKDGQQTADFFDCLAFGKAAEFTEKYLHQGTKIVIQGRLQNNNYTDKHGQKVYHNQIVIENQEFAESKKAQEESAQQEPKKKAAPPDEDGFMKIEDCIDEELPFV